ncbi:hypothetical protein QA640_09270 [Bradyrhizobium sp. CB82]|uniref:hypothetical protein n=1 Tax=Bradyrhizobium sp. CB82 TaxID=3039159 RepID=UPI0024B17B95|nr:hypothetical protein [Bradyrhizobium sp. CB82]WFU42624.1 hypothetical protein QA640_09270 [Bradyrhizobium sp. CB82]
MLSDAIGERDDLIDALEAAHDQINALLAMLAGRDYSFDPSETELWPEIDRRTEILQRHRRMGGKKAD